MKRHTQKPTPLPETRAIRVNITLAPWLHKAAKALVQPLLYANFSDLVAGLIRDKIAEVEQRSKAPKQPPASSTGI